MVGVILNLAVWFALHVLFGEVREVRGPRADAATCRSWPRVNLASLVLTVAAVLAIFRFKVGMIPVLGGCAAAGIALRAATGGL